MQEIQFIAPAALHDEMLRLRNEKQMDFLESLTGMDWGVADEKVISGGENIYPVQIENFLSKHPKIKDVAVIGLADERLGEISAAIIELNPDTECTEEEINEFCKELPRYKRPRKVIFAEVPRNATGKIEKPKLREIYHSKNLVDAQNRG